MKRLKAAVEGKLSAKLERPGHAGAFRLHLHRLPDEDTFGFGAAASAGKSEGGKKSELKSSAPLPAGNKRLVLTDILYHTFVCSFCFCFEPRCLHLAQFPSFFPSFFLAFFPSFRSHTHTCTHPPLPPICAAGSRLKETGSH